MAWAGLVAVAAIVHVTSTLAFFGSATALLSAEPIAAYDYPLHRYFAEVASENFWATGSRPGYATGFWAGFENHLSFDPGSISLQWCTILLRPITSTAVVQKMYLCVVVLLFPLTTWLAARWFGFGHREALVSGILTVWLCRGGQGLFMLRFGLVGFMLAAQLSLLAAAALHRALPTVRTGAWVLAWMLTTLAGWAHPFSGAILTMLTMTAVLWWLPRFRPAQHVCFFVGLGAALVLNLGWLSAAQAYMKTAGSGVSFMYEPDVRNTLGELFFGPQQPLVLVLFAFAIATLLLGNMDFWQRVSLAGCLAIAFVVCRLHGLVPALGVLQPTRYFVVFEMLVAIIAAPALIQAIYKLPHRAWLVVSALIAVRLFLPWEIDLYRQRSSDLPVQIGLLEKQLGADATADDVLRAIERRASPAARVLFESWVNGLPGEGKPFGQTNLAALLPTQIDSDFIGGPQPYPWAEVNFVQCHEGKAWGLPIRVMHPNEFRKLSQQYNVGTVAVWSTDFRQFVASNPQLFDEVEQVGRFVVATMRSAPGLVAKGAADVRREKRSVHLSNVQPEDGELVLRMHVSTYISADPEVAVEPLSVGEDPVPFVLLRDPPQELTLSW